MHLIRSGFGDLIKHRTPSTPKLSAEVGRLDIHFLHRVRIGDRIRGTGDRYVVVLHPVNHEVVTARPLSVH